MLDADAQRLADPARARAEQQWLRAATAALHLLKSENRLQGADKDGAARPADEIEAPMNAVGPVDIGMAGLTEHDGGPRCRPPETVGGGIIRLIGFRFDDDAADAGYIQSDADQVCRNGNSTSVEKALIHTLIPECKSHPAGRSRQGAENIMFPGPRGTIFLSIPPRESKVRNLAAPLKGKRIDLSQCLRR